MSPEQRLNDIENRLDDIEDHLKLTMNIDELLLELKKKLAMGRQSIMGSYNTRYLAVRLLTAMKELMTYREISRITDIPIRSLSQYILSKRLPKIDTCKRIVENIEKNRAQREFWDEFYG